MLWPHAWRQARRGAPDRPECQRPSYASSTNNASDIAAAPIGDRKAYDLGFRLPNKGAGVVEVPANIVDRAKGREPYSRGLRRVFAQLEQRLLGLLGGSRLCLLTGRVIAASGQHEDPKAIIPRCAPFSDQPISEAFDYCARLYFAGMETIIKELNLNMHAQIANLRQGWDVTRVGIITSRRCRHRMDAELR